MARTSFARRTNVTRHVGLGVMLVMSDDLDMSCCQDEAIKRMLIIPNNGDSKWKRKLDMNQKLGSCRV